MEKYLTVPQTAEYLNTSESFIRRLVAERRIAFHHVGEHVRFALLDPDGWLVANLIEPIDATVLVRRIAGVA